MDASQASKGSGSGTARGSGSQAGFTDGRKKPVERQGEATSPVIKTPRARKTSSSKGQVARSGTAATTEATGSAQPLVTGQKRK